MILACFCRLNSPKYNMSDNNRQHARKNNFSTFFVFMKFRPPTPLKLQFLPNNDRICKYLNTYPFIRHGTIVLSIKKSASGA